jgi:hypothetical protein
MLPFIATVLSSISGSMNENVLFGNSISLQYDDNNGGVREDAMVVRCNASTSTPKGGTLYIYDTTVGDKKWKEVIDLGDTAVSASCPVGIKPHMVLPSPDKSLVAISYTGDRHVHILDATTRMIRMCLEVKTEGSKIHTGHWMVGEGSSLLFVMVDMTGKIHGASGGGGLHLWRIDKGSNMGTLISSLSMPISFLLPSSSTKPIAAGSTRLGDNTNILFVTDAKQGGGFFVEVSTLSLTPKGRIQSSQLGNCKGGGGLWVSTVEDSKSRLMAVYGKQETNTSCIVEVDVSTKLLSRVIHLPATSIDVHGIGYCRNLQQLYVLTTNRISADLDITRYSDGKHMKHVQLEHVHNSAYAPYTGACEGKTINEGTRFMQPDIFDMQNGKIYQATRGRAPLSAVSTANMLIAASPGMYTYTVKDCLEIIRTESDVSLPANDIHTVGASADPHGGALVGDEFWMIDQAPSGVILLCDNAQTYLSKERLISYGLVDAYAEQKCDFDLTVMSTAPTGQNM